MRHYAYYPGCSLSDGGAQAFDKSLRAVAKALDVDLIELEEWNCCGSSPTTGIDGLTSHCLAARNLALAEKTGFDILAPCASCYVILNRTNHEMIEDPGLRSKIDQALAAGNMQYNRTVKVRHLLNVLVNDIGLEAIVAKVTKKLEGLKVASYYGCQVVRPGPNFDHPENPQTMDRLVEALGATASPFPLKSRCCGGSLVISEESTAVGHIAKLLDSAVSNGADVMVTVCPMCQNNMDAYQSMGAKRLKSPVSIPVLYLTQLIGLAMGLPESELHIKDCIVSPRKALAKFA